MAGVVPAIHVNPQWHTADRSGAKIYIPPITTVEDIEKAIATLKPGEFDRLRIWFEEFQAARFDEKIERDAKAGKLDRAAGQALDDHHKGRSREL
jgi:hypothetical protein